MRSVLREIVQARRRYARLPLFEFMRDESLSPRERLAFFPCMAPFALASRDLSGEEHRRPWYIEDLTALGYDRPVTTTQLLRSQYGDDMKVSRMLMARLAHLLYDATPMQRLAIFEAMREADNVLFALTADLASRIELVEGITLRYLGDHHWDLETGPAMIGADQSRLAAIELDEVQRARALTQVQRVFEYFEEWTEELLAYARA